LPIGRVKIPSNLPDRASGKIVFEIGTFVFRATQNDYRRLLKRASIEAYTKTGFIWVTFGCLNAY